jgi:ribosome biogenesis GTPase
VTGTALDGLWIGSHVELSYGQFNTRSISGPLEIEGSGQNWRAGAAALVGYSMIVSRGLTVQAGDHKGRHTTTGRSLNRLPAGGWLIDTPGIRELQLADVKTGVDEVFEDIAALVERCRFADCRHEREPGCAIRAAIEAGILDPERLRRHRKLAAEESRNSASLAERLARDKAFGKMTKGIMRDKRRRQDL